MGPAETRRPLATPAAPFSSRPPSPPGINIPAVPVNRALQPITIVPSFENVDPAALSASDLQIITQNGKEQIATDSALKWTWQSRRQAQPVLDFLYLGPSSVVKDRQWLKDNGFTMLLAARTSWMAEVQLLSVHRVAEELGIQAEHVDVSDNQELIRAFPSVVRKINDHMLRIYREQAVSNDGHGQHEQMQTTGGEDSSMVIDQHNFQRGKVLVFCESGNDRSAAVVVAYLMAVFGLDIFAACQFVQYRRFSVSLDDNLKQLLNTYQGILEAQRTVNTFHMNPANVLAVSNSLNNGSSNFAHKRGIEDAMHVDGEDESVDASATYDGILDADRYRDRPHFVPFVDHTGDV
ncbi:protein-tyrosine phosphatase-like protein [Microdochium trichocladiopsis]|uniref:Protein-tyrosine phosphatase-like protein n=1 Tax=Microdochium trichocladiopsis TaxID=1682393 RepID=A0A9P8Y6X1_9PEZI|nr:protein-tyrosine phosphatase-like protein [Microdochium trichocladiopsis]KAH7031270.1 protein-tyrosine phosphatase-like protein [Microdochium trichocladiopsis]